MPGTFIVFDAQGRIGREREKLDGAVEQLLHDERYSRRILLATDNLYFGYTYHDKYETHAFRHEERIICIDGQIYGKSREEMERELSDLTGASASSEDICKWILGTDGEFAVCVVRKDTGEIQVWNDYLARMPLYYSCTDGMLILSREISFISAVTGNWRFNRDAVPEYLLYGYPLGNKTLFENIHHLEAASLLRGGRPHKEPVIERLHSYNFDEKSHGTEDIRQHAGNLVDLFQEACRTRIDSVDRNVIALSGGLDSRSVAISLSNLKAPFSAVTFLDYFGSFSADIEYAKQIAQTLGIEQELVRLERAKGRDVLELLRIKGGMNYLGVSFAIPLIRRIREIHGDSITLFTGDGGDRVFRDTRPVGSIRNLHSLASYIIAHNQMIPLDVVSAITGTDRRKLIAGLEERLSGYPERDMKMKYLHFVFYERCPNWHFQGEDRNRSYVRPVTPFYSTPLFDYSMRLPDQYKADFRLYREILVRLSPQIAAINNSEWRFPITSKKLGLYSYGRRMYFTMPTKIRRIVQLRHWYRKKLNIYDDDSNIMKCFTAQLQKCEAISDYLSVTATEKNLQRIYKMGFDHLFTLTSLIEQVHGGAGALAEYLESDIM
jgi:asparagine synthase (glutamine-hydrolysing)